jgi:hypothetical protein
MLILFHADYFTVFRRDVQPFIVLALEIGSLVDPTLFGDGIVDVQDLIVLSEHLFKDVSPTQ